MIFSSFFSKTVKKTAYKGDLRWGAALFLFCVLLPLGCGRKPQAKKTEKPEAPAAAQPAAPSGQAPAASAKGTTMSFSEMLARAQTDDSYFTAVSRLLVTRSILLPLDSSKTPPEAAGSDAKAPKKISIKVLKKKGETGTGDALLFSGKNALAMAGEKLGWPKNDKGMYSFAAMNGQAVFRVLAANGYKKAILDVADPHPLLLIEKDISTLAEGQIPDFRAKK